MCELTLNTYLVLRNPDKDICRYEVLSELSKVPECRGSKSSCDLYQPESVNLLGKDSP
jgi:hypothetical protein